MPVTLQQFREALGPRYRVERELGHSGTALVFLAEDRDRGGPVALKVLRPEFARSVLADRFHREIGILRRLDHPHILPLLDSGAAGPFLFYSATYASGGSLGDRLRDGSRLPVDEAVGIVSPIAEALDYAHANNVLHRDIKPGNILHSGVRWLLADFGIARAIEASAGDTLSSGGLVLGTPAYMSPEQARAEKVDPRADIYSLACVLYEMLAGRPPFTGPTVQAVLARHVGEPPPPLHPLRSDVPAAVEGAIARALAKRPGNRPKSGAAFAALLARR